MTFRRPGSQPWFANERLYEANCFVTLKQQTFAPKQISAPRGTVQGFGRIMPLWQRPGLHWRYAQIAAQTQHQVDHYRLRDTQTGTVSFDVVDQLRGLASEIFIDLLLAGFRRWRGCCTDRPLERLVGSG